MARSGGWFGWSVTVGDPVCPRCRQPGTQISAGPWRRFGAWLRFGPGPSSQPTLRCANGHVWRAGTAAYVRRAADRWNLPGRLLGVLLHRRTMEPSPLFLLGVAGAGLATGVALDLVLGWPRWLVAAALPLLAWLGMLATAFSRSERYGLLTELVQELSPRRGRRMEERRLLELLARAPSPPIALTAWSGRRRVGARGWGDGGIHHVELVHGEPPEPPYVQVATTWRERTSHLPRRKSLPREAPDPSLSWEPITLPVGGVGRPFRYLPTGEGWVARAQLADVVIELSADGVPIDAIELEQVTDLDAYLAE